MNLLDARPHTGRGYDLDLTAPPGWERGRPTGKHGCTGRFALIEASKFSARASL